MCLRMQGATCPNLQVIKKWLPNEIAFNLTDHPIELCQVWPVRREKGFTLEGRTCVHRDVDPEDIEPNLRNCETISDSGIINKNKASGRADSYCEECFKKQNSLEGHRRKHLLS